jgi:hypothetical protein
LALALELLFGKGFVCVVDGDVVPGVELEDVVAFFEVARAEGEGVGSLLVVGWEREGGARTGAKDAGTP